MRGNCHKQKMRNPAVAGFFKTSTAFIGHKALNLVRRVIVLTVWSICRDLSAAADDLDAYGEAFVITLVSRASLARMFPGASAREGQAWS